MKRLAVALFGLLAFAAAPGLAQPPSRVSGPASAPALECPVPEPLAESPFAVSCGSSVPGFIERVLAPTACGKGARVKSGEACGVLLYVLDRELAQQFRLPLMVAVRIGRVTHIAERDQTVMTLVKSNGSSENLTTDRIYELLLPIRVNERVMVKKSSGIVDLPDQTTSLKSQGLRYYPAIFIGRGEAEKAMTGQSIKTHFALPVQILQDLTKLLDERCLVRKLDC